MPVVAALIFGAEATDAAMRNARNVLPEGFPLPERLPLRLLFHVFDETPAARDCKFKLVGSSRHVRIHIQSVSQFYTS